MKKIVFILIALLQLNIYAQSFDVNFVMIAEVNTKDCSPKENVFFITKVLNTKVDNVIERHRVFEPVKQNYIDVIIELVKTNYPEYQNSNCISEITDWIFFEEWSTTSKNFKEYITQKYNVGKIIEVDFIMKTESNTIIVEEKKKEIDPNQALIDAYYTQALSHFEANNFNKTLTVLEKTEELIGDKVNLDVMLLEAKAKIEVDKNINEVKELLNEFVREAAKQNDDKLSEGANLLVTLETSDLYHSSGFKKEFESTMQTDTDVLTCIDQLDDKGNIIFSTQLSEKWDNDLFKEIDNSIANEQKMVNYNQNNSVGSEEYYLNGLPVLVVFEDKRKVDYYQEGKLAQTVVFNEDDVEITVMDKSGQTIFTINNISLLENYPINLSRDLKFDSIKNLGKVKQIKELLEKEEFNIYNFDSKGMPTQKLYYKKIGKLRDTYDFDKGSSTWVEVK